MENKEIFELTKTVAEFGLPVLTKVIENAISSNQLTAQDAAELNSELRQLGSTIRGDGSSRKPDQDARNAREDAEAAKKFGQAALDAAADKGMRDE